MREEDSIATEMREILLNIEEFKQVQFTGSDQVVVDSYTTSPVNITLAVDTPARATAWAYIEITANNLPENSALIAFVVPEVSFNGSLVQNDSSSGGISTLYSVNTYRDKDLRKNRFELFLTNTTESESVSVTAKTFSVKFHVYASAKTTAKVGAL